MTSFEGSLRSHVTRHTPGLRRSQLGLRTGGDEMTSFEGCLRSHVTHTWSQILTNLPVCSNIIRDLSALASSLGEKSHHTHLV